MSNSREILPIQRPALDLSSLPVEIILNILKNVDNKDIKSNVVSVSKFFHDIVHEFYLNSLYDDGLRFKKWQDNKIKRFKEDIQNFKNAHRVGFFNRPHEDSIQKLVYYTVLSAVTGIGLFLLLITYSRLSELNESNPNQFLIDNEKKHLIFLQDHYPAGQDNYGKYREQVIKHTEKRIARYEAEYNDDISHLHLNMSIILLSMALFVLLNIILVNQANRDYRLSLISDKELDKYNDLLYRHKLFVTDDINITLRVNVSTLNQLMQKLEQILENAQNRAAQLNTYLSSQRFIGRKKWNQKDYAALDEVSPQLANYAKNTMGLWLRIQQRVAEVTQRTSPVTAEEAATTVTRKAN